MTRFILAVAFLLGLALAGPLIYEVATSKTDTVAAHPGGVDDNGCHTCRTNCAQYGIQDGYYHRHDAAGEEIDCFAQSEPSPEPAATNTPTLPREEATPNQQAPPGETAAPAASTPTSALGAPVAGFGPGGPNSGTFVSWLVAGLLGAGIAWLVTGAAGLRPASRLTSGTARVAVNNRAAEKPARQFIPRMRRMGSRGDRER